MVKILFDKNAKEIRIINDAVSLEKAQETADAMKQSAFGVISGIVKAFSKEKVPVELSGYIKRYKPFWHVKGAGEFEYKRNTQYSFGVKPEVRDVNIHGKVVPVNEDSPTVTFIGEDHCYEYFEKEIIQSASEQQEKKLERYLEFDSKKVASLPSDKNVEYLPLHTRASFLVNSLIKEVVKPIHADKILTESVTIIKLVLYYRPFWVFEFTEPNTDKKRHIEVDAVTGEAEKVEKLDISKTVLSEQSLFDITAEIAGNILPGAGVGLVVGKAFKDHRAKKKNLKKMQQSLEAYKTRKGGRGRK